MYKDMYKHNTYVYTLLQLSESHRHLRELESVLTKQNTAIHPYLKSINSLLYQALMTTKAAVGDQVKPYEINKHVAAGKNPNLGFTLHAKKESTKQTF